MCWPEHEYKIRKDQPSKPAGHCSIDYTVLSTCFRRNIYHIPFIYNYILCIIRYTLVKDTQFKNKSRGLERDGTLPRVTQEHSDRVGLQNPGVLCSINYLKLPHLVTGEGNGNSLQYSCLENPRDGEPGGLPSMGSHRVGQTEATQQQQHLGTSTKQQQQQFRISQTISV